MNREKEIVKTSFIGIIVNVLLVGAKATIGFIANSISIVLDAINNLTDALSSVVTIIGTKIANKKPDKKHPYGHGRIEYITNLIVGAIILVAGVTAGVESFNKILTPNDTKYTYISIIVIALALVVKIFLGLFFVKRGKKLNSESLKSSGKDALFDALISATTLIGIAFIMIWQLNIEGYIGILISVFIIKASFEIMLSTLNEIIGVRVDPTLSKSIKDLVMSHEEILGVYDLVLHNYGPEKIMGSLHIELSDSTTASEIHRLTRHLTEDIFNEFGIIVTIGIYASNDLDDKNREIKNYLESLVKVHKEILNMHGFYVDSNKLIITCDLLFDFNCDNKFDIINEIKNKMNEKYNQYYFDIVIDADYAD